MGGVPGGLVVSPWFDMPSRSDPMQIGASGSGSGSLAIVVTDIPIIDL